jgi:putative transcriptional regulator
MIQHHPSEEILASHASGALRAGAALAVACHLDACAQCRREAAVLDQIGGLLFEVAAPATLSEGALERALQQIGKDDWHEPEPAPLPTFLAPFDVPKRLRNYEIVPRRWLAPKIWFAPIITEPGAESCTYFVSAAKNVALPRHTHAGEEFTMVLSGAFQDDLGRFSAGDFVEVNDETWHAPNVTADAACLCLISSDGPMKLEGLTARIIQAYAGMRY